ncbi:GNAT family N-acetyltransferase [Kribbella sandramycini]|uniref:GNAT family N-acetyltransferase n=1 Tax=Kribbella sandramycini TaxID=60450 RepID=A0A7Y4P170_9ACTN|nr:GNAT family N-acetyltransferase [Kribbella sandramycini]MBB6571222.1 GNAT superfamily N-acetyltransferase [Kribbella sandramycini]NOL43371.1 GNAT family N-acetyltransferase [Kribbella sandramycini]
MSRLDIRPFETTDLPAAAVLLAERHRAHRKRHPLLSPAYEDPQRALVEVTAIWESADASGAVLREGGEVTGYLLGAPKQSPVWGPNVWVEAAGHAVRTPEHIRDLYGAAAVKWVAEGRIAHYTLVPDDAELLDAWFRLAFGSQHAHAIQPVPATPIPPRAGVLVRRAVRADIPVLAELDLALPQHQGLSPVFAAGTLPSLQEAIDEWEEDFDDPVSATFVAESNGRVIGSATGTSIERGSTHSGLSQPDNAGFLGFAAVLPEARGLGAGRALGEAVLNWSAETGYDSVVTDWRVTNLLSSRAWPALGFAQTFHRLHRLIGH